MTETPERKLYRAPGKATKAGAPVCPCAHWARPIDDNFRAASLGEADLDHAPLCDGRGKPTRPVYADELLEHERAEDEANGG
jgi:hypothetical protein